MASEVVIVSGHIIDSLILPKILDEIMDLNGTFEILATDVNPSFLKNIETLMGAGTNSEKAVYAFA